MTSEESFDSTLVDIRSYVQPLTEAAEWMYCIFFKLRRIEPLVTNDHAPR